MDWNANYDSENINNNVMAIKIDVKIKEFIHTWISLGMMVPLWGTTLSNPDSILFNFHWYLITIINPTAHSEYTSIKPL